MTYRGGDDGVRVRTSGKSYYQPKAKAAGSSRLATEPRSRKAESISRLIGKTAKESVTTFFEPLVRVLK